MKRSNAAGRLGMWGVVLAVVVVMGLVPGTAQATNAPLRGLQAYFPMNGDAEDKVSNHNGTLGTGASYTNLAKFGQAVYLDGTTNGSVDLSNVGDLVSLNQGTVCMWVSFREQVNESRLFNVGDKDDGLGPPNQQTVWALTQRGDDIDNDGELQYFAQDQGGAAMSQAYTDGDMPDTNFYHLAIACDRSGNPEIYIDGVSQALNNVTPGDHFFADLTDPDYICVGVIRRGNDDAGEGKQIVDELYIYDRPLSATEVSQVMNADEGPAQGYPSAPEDGLVAYWPGNGNTKDEVGDHDGTLGSGGSYTNGVYGQGFYLNDPANGYMEAGNPSDLVNLSTGTVCMWVSITDTTPNETRLIGVTDSNTVNNAEWDAVYRGSGAAPATHYALQFAGLDNGLFFHYYTAQNSWEPTNFVHLAIVCDGVGDPEIFLNGNSESLTLLDAGDFFFASIDNADNVKFGGIHRPGGVASEGPKILDEIYIYSRPLSAAEVNDVMNAVNGPPSGAIGTVIFIR